MSEKHHKHASQTFGVKPMPIIGRTASVRERLLGMTEQERAWRAQWLKDQHLAPDEPVHNPEYYSQRFNILRRFYRYPWEKFQSSLTPVIGADYAFFCRHLITKTLLGLSVIYYTAYWFKYNRGDWTRPSGMRYSTSRAAMFPGDPGYPNYETKSDREFGAFGFDKSPI